MTEKELRHLGRRELIEIIIEMKKREIDLQKRLDTAEQQLKDRTIRIQDSGSIAEAALSLSGVFEAAQAAADMYLQSVYAANAEIDDRLARTKAQCRRMLEEAEQEAQARLQGTGKKDF